MDPGNLYMEDMVALAGPEAFKAWVTTSAQHQVEEEEELTAMGEEKTREVKLARQRRWLVRVRNEYVRVCLEQQQSEQPSTIEQARELMQLAALERAYRGCASTGGTLQREPPNSRSSFIRLAEQTRKKKQREGKGPVRAMPPERAKAFTKNIAKLLKYSERVVKELGKSHRAHADILFLLAGKTVQRLAYALQMLGPADGYDLGCGIRPGHLQRMGLEVWRCGRCVAGDIRAAAGHAGNYRYHSDAACPFAIVPLEHPHSTPGPRITIPPMHTCTHNNTHASITRTYTSSAYTHARTCTQVSQANTYTRSQTHAILKHRATRTVSSPLPPSLSHCRAPPASPL